MVGLEFELQFESLLLEGCLWKAKLMTMMYLRPKYSLPLFVGQIPKNPWTNQINQFQKLFIFLKKNSFQRKLNKIKIFAVTCFTVREGILETCCPPPAVLAPRHCQSETAIYQPVL